MSRFLRSFTIFLGAASVCASDPAQEVVPDLSLDDLMGLTITTVSKKQERPSGAPATVHVITGHTIRERGYANLKDVLADLPGMETISNYFSEIGTLVPVRGVVGNNKIIVMVNGLRVNPPGGEEFPFRSDFSVRDAEQIEVVYGPGSTLYGQDAINAVINIKTRKADPVLSLEALAMGGSGGMGEGFLSARKQVSLANGKRIGITGFVQGQIARLDDFREVHPGWWEQYRDIAASTGSAGRPVRFDDGLNGMLRFDGGASTFQAWHRESSRSSSEGGYTPILQFVDEAVWHDRTTVLEVTNALEITPELELSSAISYARHEIDPETRYVFPISPTTLFLDDFKYGLGTSLAIEERIGWSVSERFYLTSGFVLGSYDIIPKATVPGGADTRKDIPSAAGDFTYYTVKGDLTSIERVNKVNNLMYQNYAGYVESHWQALTRLKLISGLRIDANTRYEDIPFSPRLAAVIDVLPGLVAKYIYSQAYVAPAPYFGYNNFDNGQAINVANPDLSPETAASNEFNLFYTFRNAHLSASAYQNVQENLIITGDQARPVNIIRDTIWVDTAFTSTRTLVHSANSGRSVSRGVDLSARLEARRYSLWASYSYVDFESRIQGATTGLDGLSANQVRAGVTARLMGTFSATTSLSYRSAPEALGGNPAWLEGYDAEIYEIRLFAQYHPFKALEILGGVENATDNRYALKGILDATPQEGRKFSLGLRTRF